MHKILFSKYCRLLIILIYSLLLWHCEEEKGPIASDEITIVVNSMNQSDINDNGIIEKDENISNSSGNPWGEFIKEAETECGTSAKYFDIVGVSVQLSDTENIDGFEEIISGLGEVYFINTQGSDIDADRVLVGNSNNLTGMAPNELTNLAIRNDLSLLYERLLGGDFHVGFRGVTILTKDDNFSFDVIIRFVVKAYCD